MGKITGFISNLQNVLMGYWGKQSSLSRLLIVGGFITFAAGLSFFLYISQKADYQYVFVDIGAEDSTAILDFMKKNNYSDFIVDAKGIQVPVEQVDKLRLSLSQEGLPGHGVVGWEKFDDDDFTRTEFEQEVQKIRAIQGELSRTISAIEGISSARVHIVVPRESLFSRDKKKATAAIYLQSKRGFTIDQKTIKGVQHLVSRSVEGLETNDITILDSSGQMLTEAEPTEAADKQSRELLNYKKNIEKNLEERIKAIVGKVVGLDRIEAKVDAQVDFTQERQSISDVDPDKVAVLSKNSTGFSMEGSGLNPTGIPGAKSNVPGEGDSVSAAGSKSGSKKDTELVNYEISKKVSEEILPVGNITRLTVSAIVDGKQIYPMDGTTPQFEPRSAEELKQIEDLIRDAVGFKETRDSLTVRNMMFQLDPFQIMEIKKQRKDDRSYISTLAVSAALAIALILFFAFIVRPYFRWLAYDPERKKAQALVEEYKPDLEIGEMQSVQVQEEVPFEKMTPKEQVVYLARNEPRRTTEAIRILISPNIGGGA